MARLLTTVNQKKNNKHIVLLVEFMNLHQIPTHEIQTYQSRIIYLHCAFKQVITNEMGSLWSTTETFSSNIPPKTYLNGLLAHNNCRRWVLEV